MKVEQHDDPEFSEANYHVLLEQNLESKLALVE
jgi:hypothetical protein